MTKRILLIVLGIAIVLLLVGLAATWVLRQTDTTNQTSPTPTPTITSSATPSATPTGQATGTPTAACASSQLLLGHTDQAGGGAAGSIYSTITLKNTSQQTCTLAGYPGVSLVHNDSVQVGQPAERSTTNPLITISLSPGGMATTTLRVVQNNFDPGVCQDGATQLRVYPPDQTEPLLLPTTITTWCPGFSVTALAVFLVD